MTLFLDSLAPASPLLPLLIFVAETVVVTLSTIRIIFVSRGMKVFASALGFFEISIWLFAIGQIMQNLSDLGCYLAFASGFTLGNFLGVFIEKKLAIGTLLVRAITNRDAGDLMDRLKLSGYGVTSIDAQGATGPVTVVLTVIQRKELSNVVALVQEFDSKAFYSVGEIREAAAGIFPRGPDRLGDGLRKRLKVFYPAKSRVLTGGSPNDMPTGVAQATV